MTITEKEDKLIDVITALGLFAVVDSAGRESVDDMGTLVYPACSIMFLGDDNTGVASRPIDDEEYIAFVSTKNLQGEQEAAQDAYALIDATRDAIHGKLLEMTGCEPWKCTSRKLSGYQDGIITYTLKFTSRQSRSVVIE
jgi:hypothetical protein